jgi:hypothetical protein
MGPESSSTQTASSILVLITVAQLGRELAMVCMLELCPPKWTP